MLNCFTSCLCAPGSSLERSPSERQGGRVLLRGAEDVRKPSLESIPDAHQPYLRPYVHVRLWSTIKSRLTSSLFRSFTETPEAVSDFTFDDPDANPKEHRVYEALVKDRLVDLFRRHGAIE